MSGPTLLYSFLSLFLLFLSSSVLPVSSITCDKNDTRVLLNIKEAFGNPSALASWDSRLDCCSWAGIFCEGFTGQVLGLNISNAGDISGPIPPSIGDLPVLSYITLHDLPRLTGPLPTSLTKLTLLKTLNVSRTGLAGTIPTFLSVLPQLIELDLSANQLSGPVPGVIGTGPLIFSINLSHNRLSGAIPSSLFRGFLTNPILDLSDNQLTGPIPRALGKVNWGEINLSMNQFTGDASFLFGESKLTTKTDLSKNNLEFDMSSLRIPINMVSLDVSHNRIRGSIPAQIKKVANLKSFNVSYNLLCGRIPLGGPMRRFNEWSYVHNQCLCGKPLPPCK